MVNNIIEAIKIRIKSSLIQMNLKDKMSLNMRMEHVRTGEKVKKQMMIRRKWE